MISECQLCGYCSRPVTGVKKGDMKLCPACGGTGSGAHSQCSFCEGHGVVRLSVKRRGPPVPSKKDFAGLVKGLPD